MQKLGLSFSFHIYQKFFYRTPPVAASAAKRAGARCFTLTEHNWKRHKNENYDPIMVKERDKFPRLVFLKLVSAIASFFHQMKTLK